MSKVLIEEVNSANDNPIVNVEKKHVYHGGNFHGDYISLEMDKLKLVVAKLSMLAERQLNYLLNSKLCIFHDYVYVHIGCCYLVRTCFRKIRKQ